jgi:hypothetical protein
MKSTDHIEQANRRARELQAHVPRVVSARYNAKAGRIVVHLSSKLIISFAAEDVQGLDASLPSQLSKIEISPSAFGLHFPAVDADIYVPGLLDSFPGSKSWMGHGSDRLAVGRHARPGKQHLEQMGDWEKAPKGYSGREVGQLAAGEVLAKAGLQLEPRIAPFNVTDHSGKMDTPN